MFLDKPTQTKLEGDILARAKAVKDLLVERKNLNKLVTSKSLLEYGFYNQGFGQIPLITFDKKRKPKKALECLKRSLATLSGKGRGFTLLFISFFFGMRSKPYPVYTSHMAMSSPNLFTLFIFSGKMAELPCRKKPF